MRFLLLYDSEKTMTRPSFHYCFGNGRGESLCCSRVAHTEMLK